MSAKRVLLNGGEAGVLGLSDSELFIPGKLEKLEIADKMRCVINNKR